MKSLKVSEYLHVALKKYAAKEKQTITASLEQALLDYLKANGVKRGLKK